MSMKTELATVAARDLQHIEYRGQRVVTTEQMAAGYGTDEVNIRKTCHVIWIVLKKASTTFS
jgi:hypothetical protein